MRLYPPNARVALKNGKFVDVVNGCYFAPDVSLMLEGGKIRAMPGLPGEAADLPVDLTIDLQGKTVIPGLFNTHTHLQMTFPSLLAGLSDIKRANACKARQIAKNMADCLAHGVTHVRDALTEDLRRNRTLKAQIASGAMAGPRIWQNVVVSQLGGSFTPPRNWADRLLFRLFGMPQVDYADPASGSVVFPPEADAQTVRDAVNRAIDERGADGIKIYEQAEKRLTYKPGATVMTLAQLAALTDQARRRGVPTTMHHTSVASFRRAVQTGVTSFAHLPLDALLTEADIAAFNAAGGIIEPTVSLAYYLCWNIKGHACYEHPEFHQLADFRNRTQAALATAFWLPELRESVKAGLAKANQGKMKLLGILDISGPFTYYARLIPTGIANLRRLAAQGACLACANDAGAVPCTAAMLQHEIDLCALFLDESSGKSRFSGADALRMATINSAKAMGIEQQFGSIRTGKTADLVVVDGDPFADMRVIGSRAAALFMDGKMVINNCGLQVEATNHRQKMEGSRI